MKKISNIIISLLLTTFAMSGIVGCAPDAQNGTNKTDETKGELGETQNNEVIPYKVVCEGYFFDCSDERLDFIGISNSVDEVKALCEQNNYLFFDENSTDYVNSYGETIREYTPDYFADKSLIVCAFTKSTYPGTYTVEQLVIKENTLTVQTEYHNEYGYIDDVVVGWVFIIEVDKSSVSSIKSVLYHLV